MFSTGFRELIVNRGEDLVITDVAGVPTGLAPAVTDRMNIGPLGAFSPTLIIPDGIITPSSPAVAGVYNITGTSIGAGNTKQVKVFLSYAGRLLADIYPERKTLVFQFTEGNFGAAAAKAVYDHFGFDVPFEFTDGGGQVATLTFKAGYEGISVIAVTAQEYDADGKNVGLEAIYKVGNGIAEDVAPTEGVGLGKLLEASVKSAVAENLPYAPNEFGSDMPDVRGTYTEYAFSVAGNIEGWEEHEDVGRSILNQENTSKNTKYIIYLNDNAGNDAHAWLDNLVTGAAWV